MTTWVFHNYLPANNKPADPRHTCLPENILHSFPVLTFFSHPAHIPLEMWSIPWMSTHDKSLNPSAHAKILYFKSCPNVAVFSLKNTKCPAATLGVHLDIQTLSLEQRTF